MTVFRYDDEWERDPTDRQALVIFVIIVGLLGIGALLLWHQSNPVARALTHIALDLFAPRVW